MIETVFSNSIERWRKGLEIFVEEFLPFNVFIIVQIRFSNNRQIKIIMIYLYIKPEVKTMMQQQWLQL